MENLVECASVIRALGADIGNLPVAYSESGWKNSEEISKWAREYDEIIFLQDEDYYIQSQKYKELKVHKNVLVVAGWSPSLLNSEGHFRWPTLINEWPGEFWFYKRTMEGVVIEVLAKAWSISLSDILSVSKFSGDISYEREIGIGDGKSVIKSVDIIKNPKNFRI